MLRFNPQPGTDGSCRRSIVGLVVICGLVSLPTFGGDSVGNGTLGHSSVAYSTVDDWQFAPRPTVSEAQPETQPAGPSSVQMILDDGTAEGSFGIGTANARQFLWLNHFSPGADLILEQIWVLFPASVQVGAAIDLVIYRDDDGDPSNGAELLAVIPETVRQADGTAFSIYELGAQTVDSSLAQERLGVAGEVYLGVIPRFIVSGSSEPVLPATLDTTGSQGRSWIAVWTGDPPLEPILPPDGQVHLIDDLLPGNWMIRGVGRPRETVDVPALGPGSLVLMSFLLLSLGLLSVRLQHR